MAKFVTYYETGSTRAGTIRSHKTNHNSKRAAMAKACEISRSHDGYVTVMRNGIEVGACFNGKRQ